MKLLRSFLINFGVVCCTLLVCAVAGEGVLRLTKQSEPLRQGWVGRLPDRPGTELTSEPHTGWRMHPNQSFIWNREVQDQVYRANSQGFRSDHDFDPSDPRRRVALVGDSYTWGSGSAQNKTFAALLEQDSADVVTWNFGMPGFGVDQVWLSARYQALPLKPDLLIVGLVNADFERSQIPYREGFNKPTFRLEGGKLVRRTTEPAPNALIQYLDQNSHFWAVWERAKRWMGIHYGITEYWTLNQAFLDSIREDCRAAGVPILFVYIPIKSFQPFPAIRQYMRRVGANYIDLTQQQPPPPMSIYLAHDGHLSAEGHRYVANLIQSWMKSQLPLTQR